MATNDARIDNVGTSQLHVRIADMEYITLLKMEYKLISLWIVAKNVRRIDDLMLIGEAMTRRRLAFIAIVQPGTKACSFFFGLLRPVCLGRISQSGMPSNLSMICILRLIVYALWLQPPRAF
nr:hypothetical protein [Tanacetum cinerariifolium]